MAPQHNKEIIAALVAADTLVKESNIEEKFQESAFEKVLDVLLRKQPLNPPPKGRDNTPLEANRPYENFADFFKEIEKKCKSKPEVITSMAYFHALHNPENPVLTSKDMDEYFPLIPTAKKGKNLPRDAQKAIIQAWIKKAKTADGGTGYQIIPRGRDHIEDMKNES